MEYQQNLAGSCLAIGNHILRPQLTAYLPPEFESTVIYHAGSDWDKLLKALIDKEKLQDNRRTETHPLTAQARALVAKRWGHSQ